MEKFEWPRQVFGKSCFGDLNIPIGPKSRQICEASIALGYKLLALNTPVVASSCIVQAAGSKKGKKRKWEERSGGILSATAAQQSAQSSQNGVPTASKPKWVDELMGKHQDVRILLRLSVIFYDVNHLQKVLSLENASTYDILAVIPTNHAALLSSIISTNLIFDIISFDIEGPHWIDKIKLNRQKGKLAADRSIFFELTYSPSFHGDQPLENMIYLGNRSTEDICTRRVKNFIISSGAATPEELRSPKDTIGIGYLLGLDETTSRTAINSHMERIVSKADSRRFGKSWVAFLPDKSE